jgi:hypothetical protein
MLLFAAAFTASSTAIFAVANGIGAPARALVPSSTRVLLTLLVLLAAILLDSYSLRRKRLCPLTARRQTPKMVYNNYGAGPAALVWGFDAGLVFTTYRMSSISWALLLLSVLGVAPWWTGLGYALGFLTPLLMGCTLGGQLARDGTVLPVALLKRRSVAQAACLAVLATSVVAIGRLY